MDEDEIGEKIDKRRTRKPTKYKVDAPETEWTEFQKDLNLSEE